MIASLGHTWNWSNDFTGTHLTHSEKVDLVYRNTPTHHRTKREKREINLIKIKRNQNQKHCLLIHFKCRLRRQFYFFVKRRKKLLLSCHKSNHFHWIFIWISNAQSVSLFLFHFVNEFHVAGDWGENIYCSSPKIAFD